jgi:hypothetical protein
MSNLFGKGTLLATTAALTFGGTPTLTPNQNFAEHRRNYAMFRRTPAG